jgi:carboxypeptidase C (cathepsin A)
MLERNFPKGFRKQLETVVPAPYDPCTMSEETTYLNRADVRAALHVSPQAFPWSSCSSNVNYNQTDVGVPMEPIYTELLASGNLRMVIFSGDDDSVCATLGTQHWMFNLLGQEVTEPWTQWTYTSEEYGQQIGGSIVQFKGISLVTVHGAGHMVSGYKPEKGFAVMQNFIAGNFNTPTIKKEEKVVLSEF